MNLYGGAPTSYSTYAPLPFAIYDGLSTNAIRIGLHAPGDFQDSILFMDFFGSGSNSIPYPLPLTFLGSPCIIMLDPKYVNFVGSSFGNAGLSEIVFQLPTPRIQYDILIQFMIVDRNLPAGFTLSDAIRVIL
jgi:hypothetical protein